MSTSEPSTRESRELWAAWLEATEPPHPSRLLEGNENHEGEYTIHTPSNEGLVTKWITSQSGGINLEDMR